MSDGDLDYLWEKKQKSPLVLLGAFATAGVLAGGLIAFKRGNQNASQALMRARVLLQACTVACMVATSGAVVARKAASS